MLIAFLLLILCCVFFIMVGVGYYFVSQKDVETETSSTEQGVETVTTSTNEVETVATPMGLEGTYALTTATSTGTPLYCTTGTGTLLYCKDTIPRLGLSGYAFEIKKASGVRGDGFVTIQNEQGNYCTDNAGGIMECDVKNPTKSMYYRINKTGEPDENLYTIYDTALQKYINVDDTKRNDMYLTRLSNKGKTFSITPRQTAREINSSK